MRILIVDDTTFMRATIKRLLEEQGAHELFEAENGLEATTKYKILNPDLVIMDISMPIMDGIEAVKLIKAYDVNANVIICSLQGQREYVMEAIKSGAKSFLVKPVKKDKLFAEMAKLAIKPKAGKSSNALEGFENLSQEEMDERIAKQLGEIQALTESLEDVQKSEEFLKGVETGYLEARRELTINMVKFGLSLDVIQKCVELSEEDIEDFKVQYKLF